MALLTPDSLDPIRNDATAYAGVHHVAPFARGSGVDGWPDPRLAGARRLTVCGDVGLIEVRYVRGCLKSMA
jgi:hypothetical protein